MWCTGMTTTQLCNTVSNKMGLHPPSPPNSKALALSWGKESGDHPTFHGEALQPDNGRYCSDGPQCGQVPHLHPFKEVVVATVCFLCGCLYPAGMAPVQGNTSSNDQTTGFSCCQAFHHQGLPCPCHTNIFVWSTKRIFPGCEQVGFSRGLI